MMGIMKDCRRALYESVPIGGAGSVGSRPCWTVFLCVLVAAISGCGPRGPAVEMVEGVVLLDGEPVEGATICFSPAESGGKAGLPAAGRTGAGGTFRLNSVGGARSGAGTKVGEYVVTVMKQESDPLPEPDPNAPPTVVVIRVRELLPTAYRLPATSPLKATVKKGKNTFRFELSSSAAIGPKS